MTDNRQTQEAATVREKSEFIKRIEDFANYMQKEYITDNSKKIVKHDKVDKEGER